ncbi:MAG: ferritin family protein [Deltaproteobacteria bacterium]|nr:ferritin family protein [Deltaproteobacteria bacterium]
MSFVELQDIIDFAIGKEQEAIEFYQGYAEKVKQKAIAEELRKMALMEEGHRKRLEKMDVVEASEHVAKPIETLKIADYVVEKEPSEAMNWQDVVQIAMKRELASVNLYRDLAKLVNEPTSIQLFENLAADEASHQLFWEKIWDDEILKDN